ncbi:hypothetical protein MNR01_15475 [Lysobacter sp. S4-A87]|uniref:hypothetical protein n=1 Tax=Lysobacter sp. S4-A87 TaxID=2925843 RepID=UPI001F534AFA|nr:hypothetical protein [Lysobacter sp. S4-A87]UNK49114.1 hypothetical protein MNR01_15475 [Lysobacter sp. S4-A87]
MLKAALIVFAIAAMGGLFLASHVLRGRLAPWVVSVMHALLGATGLVLVIMGVGQGGAPALATAALAILGLAALGGFYLASIHMRSRVAPKAVVFVHAGVAVTGLLVLLCAVIGL